MRAAKIVFIILTIILLIPWFVYNIKAYFISKETKKKFSKWRILSLLLVSAVMIFAVYSLYGFTIGYQIPLVAERYGEIFGQRVEDMLDFTQFESELKKQRLSSENSVFISDAELSQAGFENKRYQLSISERTYPTEDDRVIVYLKHDDEKSSLYTILYLEELDYKWQVRQHEVLVQEDFDELNDSSRIRFFEIK